VVSDEGHVFSWLFSWRQRRPLRFVLYTRAGCHLCEQAWAQLQEAQQQHGFDLQSVDVDSDPALVAAHGDCVPVVLVNGKVRFRGRVNPVLLKRLLRTGKR
jgi:glutaredoxin